MKSSDITDEFKRLGFQNFNTKGKAEIVVDLKEDFEQIAPKLERMKAADVLFIDDLFKPVGRAASRRQVGSH
jgi:hypothetical protein